MTLIEAQYLLSIAEHKSISKAADALYISQPYLSRILQRIESEIGATIFDRSKLPIKLTYVGERCISYCQKLVALDKAFQAEMSHILLSGNKRITIGVPPQRGGYLLPLVLPVFSKSHPEIEVIIREAKSDVLPKLTADGDVDLSVFSLPEAPEGIHCDILRQDLLLLMVPPNHPLFFTVSGTDNSIPLLEPNLYKLLEGAQFISIDTPNSITARLISYLGQQGVSCSIAIKTQNNTMTYRLCEEGMGPAAIMEVAAHNTFFQQKPCLFKIGTPPLDETWFIGTQLGKPLRPIEQLFIQAIHNIGPDLTARPFHCTES